MTLKPGSRDIKVPILIAGHELEELQKYTWLMSEAFGLDRRIEQYMGKKPIGFYRWDIECLMDVIDFALDSATDYPDHESSGYLALKNLHTRLQALYQEKFDASSR